MIADGSGLADELIHPLFGRCTVALVIGVNTMSKPGRLAIDEHSEPNGRSALRRPHNEMKIPGVKTIQDPPSRVIEQRGLLPDGPVT
jgi:hypothetical protein